MCTEVVVLERVATPRAARKAINGESLSTSRRSSQRSSKDGKVYGDFRNPAFSTSSSGGISYPGDNSNSSPGLSEARVVIGGVRVLLRHYLVVDEVDMRVLPRRGAGVSLTGDAIVEDRTRRCGSTNAKHHHHCQQQQKHPQQHPPGLARPLTVSGALVVRLAEVHSTASNRGTRDATGGWAVGGSAPKLDRSHERESATVVGLLQEVGFRVQGEGGGDRRRKVSGEKKRTVNIETVDNRETRENAASSGNLDVGCVASAGGAVGAGGRDGGDRRLADGSSGLAGGSASVGVCDMFERMADHGLQLCLTLAQGADRISVYTGVCAESWPPGMIPGYSLVQVRRANVCKRATGHAVFALFVGQG